ncbi:MAG: AI-2E family transporter [Methanimicrococcus sp.]|nr:AI-2E family transporter [Methanimicrococcus sp.]
MSEISAVPMPLTTNRKVWLTMVVIASLLCGVIMILFYFQELFIVILFGLCLIVLMDKAIRLFNKYTTKYTKKQKRVIAIAIIVSFGGFWGYLIIAQISNISSLFADLTNIQIMINSGTQMLADMLEIFPDTVTDRVHDFIDDMVGAVFLYVRTFVSQAFLYIVAVVLIYPIMFSMYFKDKGNLKKTIEDMIPPRFEKEFQTTSSAILTRSNNFFVAKVIESIGVASICCIGFYLIGLPGWLFLGILAGLLNNVPYIGPTVSTIPPFIIGLVIGWKVAVLAIVVCGIAQIVDNLYLIPFMISSKIKVNPLTTVLLILIFSQLFGILGMILCLPIYIISKIILVEAYKLLILIFPETAKKDEEL